MFSQIAKATLVAQPITCIERKLNAGFHNVARALLGVLVLYAFWAASAIASDVPSNTVIPNTGEFTAQFNDNATQGNIAVIELDGNYDQNRGAQFNIEPRAVIAREFYRHYPDIYDFLVVFTSFDFNAGSALAFHHAVRNDVTGLGPQKTVFDNSFAYGSAGRLQGFIDMTALSTYTTDPFNPAFDSVLQTFSHEFMHQWAAFVRFRDSDGSLSDGLRGRDGAHWSFLLNSDASLMYGNRWRDNGDGTYTSVGMRDNFSQLDLYLMGLAGRDEVAPMTLLVVPEVDAKRLPETGVTISATPKTVTIDDIIAAEGPRSPSVEDSQKDFRFAFIYLVRPGEEVDAAQLAALESIRREVGTRFNVLTKGRATVNMTLDPANDNAPGEPGIVVTPGDGVVHDNAVSAGLAWLASQQQSEGQWRDTDATAVRDTMYALRAIRELHPTSGSIVSRGAAWLKDIDTLTNDATARRIIGLRTAGMETPVETLLTRRNDDGGWGLFTNYASNPLDSALAALAVRNDPKAFATVRDFLLAHQNADGGWGSVAGGSSRVTTTSQVLLALVDDETTLFALEHGVRFLASRQHADGGFGDEKSSEHDTAQVLIALVAAGGSDAVRIDEASRYLASSQRADGSWQGSVYATALALRAFGGAAQLNWAMDTFVADPSSGAGGIPAALQLTVRNTGSTRAPATTVRLYDGDPANGGVPARADIAIPPLGAGGKAEVAVSWHTLGKIGTHTLYAVVNPDSAQEELTRSDNTASLDYTIGAVAEGVDLLVTSSDILITPSQTNSLPQPLAINTLLTNAGNTAALQVRVVIWEGRRDNLRARQVGEKRLDFPAETALQVDFDVTLQQAGETFYTVEIDPDGAVADIDRSNNDASAAVTTDTRLDLAVTNADIAISPENAHLGDDVVFTVRLRNAGTVDSPTFQVRYSLVSIQGERELLTNAVQIDAGQSVEQQIPWRSDNITGTHTFKVQMDPAGELAGEADRANNSAYFIFDVSERIDGPNLAVGHTDISFEPNPALEGSPLKIGAQVRNTGTLAASGFEVAFYAGNPETGGREIASRYAVDSLAAGESVTVEGLWSAVDSVGETVIFVVVDPDHALSVETKLDDNRAFSLLQISGLPDLAISRGDVTLQPAVPRPGETLQIAATVMNLGQQRADQVIVRLYEGETGNGGQRVGEQRIETLLAQTGTTVSFTYTAPEGEATKLHIVIDPDNAIQEKTKDNNRAVIDLSAQNADFYVSEKYISPNGDGIKDTTQFAFRVAAAQDISIEVVREDNGRVVRSHSDETLKTSQSGYWTWNGRDDRGVIVKDGAYQIRVVSAAGQIVGTAGVVVDNNRASVLDAVGTKLGYKVFLHETEELSLFDVEQLLSVSAANGDALYQLVLAGEGGPERQKILYRIDGRSGQKAAVMTFTEEVDDIIAVAVNHDATSIAIGDGRSLRVADGHGRNPRKILEFSDPIGDLIFTADQQHLIVRTSNWHTGETAIWRVSLDGDQRRLFPNVAELDTLGKAFYMTLSPELGMFVGRNGGETSLFDLDNDRVVPLEQYSGIDNFHEFVFDWSADGRYVLLFPVTDAYSPSSSFFIFDRTGALIQRHEPEYGEGARIIGGTWDDRAENVLFVEVVPESSSAYTRRGIRSIELKSLNVLEGQVTTVYEGEGGLLSTSASLDLVESRVCSKLGISAFAEQGRYEDPYAGICGIAKTGSIVNDDVEIAWIPTDIYLPERLDKVFLFDGKRIDLFDRHTVKDLSFPNTEPFAGDGHFSGVIAETAETVYYREKNSLTGRYEYWGFRSGLNLEGWVQVVRASDGQSFKLQGTASDANFARYRFEYASEDAPQQWSPVASASDVPVVNGDLGVWVPPGPGRYTLRLTIEDLAGNSRQVESSRILFSGSPAITDFYVTPRFISPNGDGIQDQAVMTYRVLEPVNFAIEIYNGEDELIRSLSREHPDYGIDAEIAWDGRDQNGIIVPDGEYRIVAQDYEFFLTVDNTPPASKTAAGEYPGALSLAGPFGMQYYYPASREYGPCETFSAAGASAAPAGVSVLTCVLTEMDWAVEEQNPQQLKIEERVKNDASQSWYTRNVSVKWDSREGGVEKAVSLDEYKNKLFRIVADDQAGNRLRSEAEDRQVVEILNIADTETVLEEIESETLKGFRPTVTQQTSHYETTGEVKPIYPGAEYGLILDIASTVSSPIDAIFVEYRQQGSGLAWSNSRVDRFLRFIPYPHPSRWYLLEGMPETTRFGVNWVAPLDEGKTYEYRLRLKTQDGLDHYSPVHALLLEKKPTLSAGWGESGEEEWGEKGIGYDITYQYLWENTRIEVWLESDGDPRFNPAQLINSFVPETSSAEIVVKGSLNVELLRCVPYTLKAIAVTIKGETSNVEPLLEYSVVKNDCDVIDVTVQSQPLRCGETETGKLNVLLKPNGGVDLLVLDHLELGRKRADGSDDIRFNEVHPEFGETYRAEISQDLLASGANVWFARMRDSEGNRVEQPVRLVGDQSAPLARITYPAEGQKICGRMLTDKDGVLRPGIEIEAEIEDPEGWGYQLDVIGGGELERAWKQSSTELNEYFGSKTGLDKTVFSERQAGVMARLFDYNGDATIQISAANWAGMQTCTQATFSVDALVDADWPSWPSSVFSPQNGLLQISYRVAEPVNVTISLYPASKVDGKWQADRTRAVKTFTAIQDAAGSYGFAWDGLDDGGNAVADGTYVIDAEYRDGCGNVKNSSSQLDGVGVIEIDTTPPTVLISSPATGEPLTMLVGVMGDATDRNLVSWALDYAAGTVPEDWSWVNLAQGNANVESNTLALWNTYGLPHGEYSLRLWAIDAAGNEAQTRVAVIVDEGHWLLTYAEIEPALFSPNDDGSFDQTAIRFGLGLSAQMTVEISGNGIIPRKLIDGTELRAGNHNLNWDGMDGGGGIVPDGVYQLLIQASGVVNPSQRQSETLHVVVDNTPPALEIASPAQSAVVRGSAPISVNMTEAHPGSYQLVARDRNGVVTIVEGEGRLTGNAGDLSMLAEGEVTLTLSAIDKVANAASVSADVIIDNTPPLVSISQPQAETFYRGANPLPIRAAISEQNLKRWTVSLETCGGLLYEGTSLPLPDDMSWTPADCPDGEHTLRVYAEDMAGWSHSRDVTVTVDNTPPEVWLTSPVDGELVKADAEVFGFAADMNFQAYWLEVAPGNAEEAVRWTRIAEGSRAVEDYQTALATLPMLADGMYTLRLGAVDKASNTAEALVTVIVVSGGGAWPIHLTAAVENQTQARLNWTRSPDSATVRYHIEQDGNRIGNVDADTFTYLVEQPGEGTLTFVIHGENASGNELASNPAVVTIGGAGLQAYISAPRDGAMVSGTLDILGTAFSAGDFKEYRLLVAAGEAPSREQYQLLRQSPLFVLNGKLGDWQTAGLPEGAVYTLLLEAEDTRGNTRSVTSTVTVDNLPPAKPTGLTAQPSGNDVTLTWNPNTEPDLDGYLLYRDGVLVNGGSDTGLPISAYVIKETTYLDAGVPDGDYFYTVEAIDLAGNISEPSDPASVSLSNGPPRAVIVEPVSGVRVNGKTTLLATSQDNDVASVQFEYRIKNAVTWQSLGAALTREPYKVEWDPQGLAHDTYEFRAVATDRSNLTDPAPPSIRIVYTDQTDRLLTARVDGADVTLEWTPSEAQDLARYVIFRDGNALSGVGADVTTYVDQDVADGRYRYHVESRNSADADIDTKPSATAQVHTPLLKQPFTPIAGRETSLHGNGLTPNAAEITLANSAGSRVAETVAVDENGAFASSTLPLQTGDNRFSVALFDTEGNRSNKAEVHVMTGDRPMAPTGLIDISADQTTIDLSWEANSEADLWGYLLRVDDELLSQPLGWDASRASSSDWVSSYAVDGDADTYWSLYPQDFEEAENPWFILESPEDQPAQITSVSLLWHVDETAVVSYDFDLEGWDGEVWVPLAEVRANDQSSLRLELGDGYRTDKLRLRFYAPPAEEAAAEIRLAEFSVRHAPVIEATNWQGGLANGRHDIALNAVSLLGLVGEASAAVEATVVGSEPQAPQNLTVTVPDIAGTLDLSWMPPAQPDPQPVTYRVYRSLTAGGPYVHVYTAPAANTVHRDAGLLAGTRYYYVVHSEDALGNVSAPSNEDSGVPVSAFEQGFETPYLFYPARPALSATVTGLTTPIAGMAAPGVTVRLEGGAASARTTTAAVTYREISLDSSDANIVWSSDGSLAVTYRANGFSLYRFAANDPAPQLLRTENYAITGTPQISPDNRHIAFVSKGVAVLYQISSGVFIPKALPEYGKSVSGVMDWSADGRLVLAGKTVSNEAAFYLLDSSLSHMTLIETGMTGDIARLQWSPAGTAFAYTLKEEWDNQIGLFRFHDYPVPENDPLGDIYPLDGTSPEATWTFAWSQSGSHFYYGVREAGYNPLMRFELATDDMLDLSGHVSGELSTLPYGAALVYLSADGGALMYHPELAEKKVLAGVPSGAKSLSALPGGDLVYTLDDGNGAWKHVRHTPAGLFRFETVELLSGDNTFIAYSLPSGAAEQASEAVLIHARAELLPDYEVTRQDIVAVPAVPWPGETVRLAVTVRNIGGIFAAGGGITISARGGDGSGNAVLYDAPLPALNAGASTTVYAEWTPFTSGAHQIVVSVDPDNVVSEIDKQNNIAARSINVGDSGATVSMDLRLSQSSYARGDDVFGAFTLVNGGLPLDGMLEIAIEDSAGYLVANLPAVDVNALGSGATRIIDALWNSGATLAGVYRMRGVLRDAFGAELTQAEAQFVLRPETLTATANLISDRDEYVRGSEAQFYGVIAFTGFSPMQMPVPAVIVVRDAADAEMFRQTQEVTPASRVELDARWSSGAAAAGAYRALLIVGDEASPLAQTQMAFTLVDEAAVTRYSGELLLSASNVAHGSGFSATGILTNTGTAAISALPVLITVSDPETGAVLAQERYLVDLPIAGRQTVQADFNTAGWPLRRHNVALQVEGPAPGITALAHTLQQKPLSVFETEPPIVSILRPADGTIVQRVEAIYASAFDALSGVREVEYQLDNGSWFTMLAANPLERTYSAALPTLADGPHAIAVRAVDNFSNTATTGAVGFTIDTLAPTIAISGVSPGSEYTAEVTPSITVIDLHLDTVAATLNGQPYASGTPVSADGSYVLLVVATDKAGNQASESVAFTIRRSGSGGSDTDPPVVTIVTPTEQAHLKRAGMLEALAIDVDSDIKKVEYRLDGGGLNLMTSVGADRYRASLGTLADGDYIASVIATDEADNVSKPVSVAFTVDATPPKILVSGVADGQTYSAAVTPKVEISDLHLKESTIELNGTAFVSGTRLTAAGSYLLSATARDQAGNETIVSLSFRIEPELPKVVIVMPGNDSYMQRAGDLEVLVTPVAAAIDHVEYQLGSDAWTRMNPAAGRSGSYLAPLGTLSDGIYTVKSRATDVDSNVSTVAQVRFTVDATPPVITISGVAEGQDYSDGQLPIRPRIDIVETNPQSQNIRLNGRPFVSGTALPKRAGSYTLTVVAIDKANNRAEKTVNFSVCTNNVCTLAIGGDVKAIPATGLTLKLLPLYLLILTVFWQALRRHLNRVAPRRRH